MQTPPTPMLDRLLAGQVLTPQNHGVARMRLHGAPAEPHGNVDETVAWLVQEDILEPHDFAQMRAGVAQASSQPDDLRAQALRVWDGLQAGQAHAMAEPRPPGKRWSQARMPLLIAAAVLVGLAWASL